MRLRSQPMLTVVVIGVLIARVGTSQQARVDQAKLQSPDAAVRARAFYDMVRSVTPAGPRRRGAELRFDLLAAQANQDDRLTSALIEQLDRENAVVAASRERHTPLPPRFDSEGYYGDLAWTVAQLRDPRAIHALIGEMRGDGRTQNAVADFGDAAVPDVLSELRSPDPDRRWDAVMVLRAMTTRPSVHLGNSQRASVVAALLSILQDPSTPLAHETAVEALMPFAASDIRRVMDVVSKTDTVHGQTPATSDHFVVREAAMRWIAQHPLTKGG